jgi:deoxyxylulose-5-phosphate synthase
VPVLQIGIGDEYIEHASREECLLAAGLDAASIKVRVLERMRQLGLQRNTLLDTAQGAN